MNCQKCGSEISENATFCETCGQQVAVVEEKKEKVALGIVGALIGALLGGASIVLLNQLGFVAAISGFILAFCTLKGYELLGKKLGIVGIVASIVLMIFTPYLADRLSWAIAMVQAWGDISLLEAFLYVPLAIQEEVILMSDYLKGLGMLYLFVALGGVGIIVRAFKNQK